MSIFEMKGDEIVVPANLRTLKEFSDILKDKKAQEYLSYIYHSCDWKSPYAKYDNPEQSAIDDFLDGKDPSKKIEEAVSKYKELSQTDSLLLLESARKAVKKLRDYFENADPNMEDDAGRSAKDLMANLKNVGDIIKKLSEWEEQIKKEKNTSTIRKGVELTKFNEG